ncbi:MAG: hypothetical protein RMJ28_00235 [Nitrososphaerota archaeon]|nr:hypothetical protein [Nitrososphaerota archaeon]
MMGRLENKPATLAAALNLAIYAVQGLRLGLESGFTAPLVLSNILIAVLFTGALLLTLLNPRNVILMAYSTALAGFVTYRMWDSVTDVSREPGFRLAHGFMVSLAWLLVASCLTYSVRRRGNGG